MYAMLNNCVNQDKEKQLNKVVHLCDEKGYLLSFIN